MNQKLKIIFRKIRNEKLLTATLLGSLIIGLVSVTLIATYLDFTFSFDKYHKDYKKIYKIVSSYESGKEIYELTLPTYTDVLNNQPGIKASTKIFAARDGDIKISDKSYRIKNINISDSGFFDVFSYKFLSGEQKTKLDKPNEAVITKSIALRIWGKTEVTGEVFNYNGKDILITGVIEDVPYNSHFQFDILISYSTWSRVFKNFANEFYTYFRVDNNIEDARVLQNAKSACLEAYQKFAKKGFKEIALIFQPLKDIYLNSEKFSYKIAEYGNKNMIKVLGLIGISTLIILIMNFVNLLTVKFKKRYKEIGIRKVLGATGKNLIFLYLAEVIMLSLSSALVSVFIVLLILKPFGEFLSVNLSDYITSPAKIILFLLCLGLVTGMMSSIFPVINLLKKVNPADLFHKFRSNKKGRLMFGVVLIQFAVVSGLITTLIVTRSQVNYIFEKNPGFDKNQIVYFYNNSRINYSTIKNEISKINGVKSVCGSQTLPGMNHSGMTLKRIGANKNEEFNAQENRIQKGFLNTFGIKLISGREFIGSIEQEKNNIILNEIAVKKLGYTAQSIIGKEVDHFLGKKTVIGVIEDFHFKSFHQMIEPLILSNYSEQVTMYSIKIDVEKYGKIKDLVKNKIKEIDPNFKLEIFFLNETLNNLYKADEKENKLIFFTSMLCLLLSLAGLTALTSYSVMQKTKDIGIRKILGASSANIVLMINKEFLKLVVIGNILILPVSWLFASSWLENYPYHISLNYNHFLITGVLLIFLSFTTVSVLCFKAAYKNPVDTIKYE